MESELRWAIDKTRSGLTATLLLQTVLVSAVYAEEASENKTTELAPINVERGEEPITELPLGIGVSGNTLSEAPGSGGDPVRGLQNVPGMIFADDQTAEPAVRGSRPGDNYFQSDFTPAGYVFHQGGIVSVYNPELIESFNIYPSAYGPEFTGVTGGVFDLNLRDPLTDQFHTTLDISLMQAGFLFEGPVNENQSFYFAARRSYLDFLLGDLIEEEGVIINEFPNYSDYQAKYVWRLSNDSTLRLTANGATDDVDADISEEAEGVENDPVFVGNFFEQTSSHEQSLIWDYQFANGASLKSTLAHNSFTSDEKAGNAGEIDVQTDGILFKSQLTHQLTNSHELKAGLELEELDVNFDVDFNAPACSEFDPDCRFTDAERLQVSEQSVIRSVRGFIKDSWAINEQLTVYPGLAFHSEDLLDKQFVEPRLALEYALRDDTTLTAGLGMYHQMPGVDEINEVFGNPDLDYIEALHASVGVNTEFANGWSYSSELHFKQLDNLVTSDDLVRYTNQGEGRAIGIDTLVRKQISDKFSGWVSVSLSDAERTDKRTGRAFDFEYDQPVNVSLVGKYHFSPKWALSAKLWAHSGSPYTPVLGATEDPQNAGLYIPQYAEINSDRLPTYKRLDIRLDREFKRKGKRRTTAYAELLNLSGSANVSGYSYNADYSERTPVEQLPTFFGFGLKTSF